MRLVTDWFKRNFSDPQIVFLTMGLIGVFAIILIMGDILLPVFASIVIAYLLEGLVGLMQRSGINRLISVLFVFSLFIFGMSAILFGLLPMLSVQVSQFAKGLPAIVAEGQRLLMMLPERYPDIISIEQIQQVFAQARTEITGATQQLLSLSISSVVGFLTLIVYLVLMPMMVFFFLKDKETILRWFADFVPGERGLATKVWDEVDLQIANYVRGKFWEVVIVWAATYAVFAYFDLQYAMLLAVAVGLSVIVPYVGATVVTVPVVVIAWVQFGTTPDFAYLMIAYLVVQAIDGNVLVPLLFGEVVNLHPVAIIVSILVFGGIWGFWGVFFAIPLATLVNAVFHGWSKRNAEMAAAR